MPTSTSYFSKSLEKGLKILALFNRETPALSQTEIASLVDLNMTSTYRYINTLVEMGYLEKDETTKRVRPSIFCLAFCNNLMRATDHNRFIKALVDDVHSRCNITIDVALSVDDDMMRIYHREAADTLTYSLPDFTRNCLHNTALGKAFLSSLPADELQSRIANLQMTAKTEHTIVDRDVLKNQLLLAKTRKYAMTVEEFLPGLIAIAAPLINPHTGRGIGAVSFDFSVLQRSPEEVEVQYAPLIIELAAKISATIPVEGRLGSV
ncbi:IclR family transcriptional regulator [Desulfopila aestuarii]|uniref:Transcriptional regulator, IclR family n=1 Tax=Desulfopila aestuarii DSM 18488 TaxID=1121416 RepID=A0A1M7YCL0_9BACT|nr:IclR family transcriptional regulator [Desulfopila aestuarii]SHO50367.1 transcriptional regulator, IclR family [Desulfopila aestuarii DSM 18488]